MRQVKNSFKTESVIRLILAMIGLLSFSLSSQFAWGFILGGIISKENINLRTKEGWFLLTLIMSMMILVLFILLEYLAIIGYISSTVSYFFLRILFNNYQNK